MPPTIFYFLLLIDVIIWKRLLLKSMIYRSMSFCKPNTLNYLSIFFYLYCIWKILISKSQYFRQETKLMSMTDFQTSNKIRIFPDLYHNFWFSKFFRLQFSKKVMTPLETFPQMGSPVRERGWKENILGGNKRSEEGLCSLTVYDIMAFYRSSLPCFGNKKREPA